MTTDTHMMLHARRGRLGAAISALLQALLLVVGLPVLLVRSVGWPLPHNVPLWADVQRAYQLRYLPDRFVIGALACAGWICWTMIVTSLAQGAIAHIRATNYQRPRLVLPGVHGLVGRWISAATLTVTLMSRPAGAAPILVKAAVAQTSTPVATIPTTTGRPATLPKPTVVRTEPTTGSTVRTIVTGEHQTYWDIAEATLGDGQRWREILNANPDLGHVDLVPAGITINIPADGRTAGTVHVVEKGDNLWTISATELTEAHNGRKPTNAQIVPYWRDVIDTNEPNLRSGDPDLIYPNETVTLPNINSDERTPPLPDPSNGAPTTAASPVVASEPTAQAATISTPTAQAHAAVTVPTSTVETPSDPTPASIDVDDDVDTDFEIPWLHGLAITGIAAAGILAAWHAQRRRRIRAHKPGDPIPVMSEPDRALISQLRAIAAERHHTAVDTAFRYLASTIGDDATMPSVTVARAGRHSVELLLDNPQTPTPAGFLRLDQQTIVINPGIADEDIAAAINDRQPPAPALVTIGADDIGTVLIDLERTAALAIEAATDTEAISLATAVLTELATQPWAEGVTVLAYGLPATADPDGRVTCFDDIEALISRAEEHLQAQIDDVIADGTHTIRARRNAALKPMAIVLGPGVPDSARVLAAAATQPGSALALICCDAIANSAWRLVTTNGRTTLEPTGLTVAARHLRPSKLDDHAIAGLAATFGPPTPEPSTANLETSRGNSNSVPRQNMEIGNSSAEPVSAASPDAIEKVAELILAVVAQKSVMTDEIESEATPLVRDGNGFDQLRLLDEPPGQAPPADLTVAAKIDHIMRRRTVELVLLDGPPRLEGVTWNGKDAARADEIVAFLALNGPSTLSQVATAIWPDKIRPGDPAKQMISRARKMLGTSDDGQLRISAGTRAAPYRLTDVGCDWHRFEQLCRLADTENEGDRNRLLRAALSLVRTPPFDVIRPGAFYWAADQCFDSRMRLKISEATHRFEAEADEPDGEWAREVRLAVTRALDPLTAR